MTNPINVKTADPIRQQTYRNLGDCAITAGKTALASAVTLGVLSYGADLPTVIAGAAGLATLFGVGGAVRGHEKFERSQSTKEPMYSKQSVVSGEIGRSLRKPFLPAALSAIGYVGAAIPFVGQALASLSMSLLKGGIAGGAVAIFLETVNTARNVFSKPMPKNEEAHDGRGSNGRSHELAEAKA